jgi:uncharacterized protein YndB with AHSA1/START domain
MELLLRTIPVAKAGMLIRKPADVVYEAFVDPAITTKFWFSKSSSRLVVGKFIRWDWEMDGTSTMVDVKALDPGRRILIEWDVDKNPTYVEWIFTEHTSNSTFVDVTNFGFSGDGDRIVEQVMESSDGLGLVLTGLKAYLEYGIRLNLIEDRFPDHLVNRSAALR